MAKLTSYKQVFKKDYLGVSLRVGLSASSPRPRTSACGLSAAIPNAGALHWDKVVVSFKT